MGVEPTKSPRPQRDRFSRLRTRSKLRIRESHPASLAYEARLGTGPSAIVVIACQSQTKTDNHKVADFGIEPNESAL